MSVHQPSETFAASRTGSHARDLLTIALLPGSALLLVVPFGLFWAVMVWGVGAALLWTSPSWTTREKTIGTAVWPGGLIAPLLALTSTAQVCTTIAEGGAGAAGQAAEPICTGFAFSPLVGVPLAIILLGAPLAVAAFLLSRADRSR